MENFDYSEYAARFQRKIVVVNGIIIYPASSEIPQDIVLIPYDCPPGEILRVAVKKALETNGSMAVFNYFQGIRWIIPDLREQLANWTHLNGKFIGQHYFMTPEVRLSYGRIGFDQSNVESEPDEPDKQRDLCIEVDKVEYKLNVTEFPRLLGVPKTFEKIDL